jgi:hypothetical protein
MPRASTNLVPKAKTFVAASKSGLTIADGKPALFAIPRFDEFARQHPFVGAKIGTARSLSSGNWMQEFEHATAYAPPGALASEIHEVRGAIRERYKSFGGPDGFLGLPLTNESSVTDGQGKFNHFERGSIFWHPSTGAREIHGEIRNHWESLGWERSWLGYPISDQEGLADEDGGRVSSFQNGDIYWWPDDGACALNEVVIHYTGMHCFGETDKDGPFGFSTDDEPVATFGVVGPDNVRATLQTRIYDDVDDGEDVFDVIELYRGKPRGLAISVLLQEHTGDDDQVALARETTQGAVDKAGPWIEKAATSVPSIGPVLGPLANVAWSFFKKDIVDTLSDFIGLAARPLGSDLITLTPRQLVRLATGPELPKDSSNVPRKFETQSLERQGATYNVYFNIFPA